LSARAERPSQSRWADEQPAVETTISLEQRLALIRNYGNFSINYSTAVQPRLSYFGDSNGYIAYRKRMGIVFALGDPVCHANEQISLLKRFRALYSRPSFVHVSESTATKLATLGFRVNEIGVDTNLDLDEYDFKGKSKEWLRYADNWITKHGYQIRESTFDEVTPAEVESVSEAWRVTRTIKKKEVRFINRPIVLEEEPDVRKWFLFDKNNRMLAFIYFDPIYNKGKVEGYVTCIKRRHPDAPPYAEHAIMKRAIEQFQKENMSVVKLGLSPLAAIENKRHRCNRLLHYTSRYYHSAGWVNRYFYSFVGHTQYKKRFRGREEKLYYASPVFFNDIRFMCLGSLCGFF
jgi:phosphatidylglycerol lysyltransferase